MKNKIFALIFYREVWQTEKTFGYEDIGAEEEFNLLREIYMTSKMDSKGIWLSNCFVSELFI